MEDSLVSQNELFAERYRITDILGDGGMGRVYLAEDTVLENEKVALKVLHNSFSQSQKQVQRFLREVQLSRKVTHENVIRAFDAGLENGRLFFTMEYVDGVTLKDELKTRGCYMPEEAAETLIEVCKGLHAIHQVNIVHRDVKPANIMRTKDGRIKITDFGVARPGMSDLTGHDEVVGSTAYMAPEIWTGKDIGAAADMYALGITFYELLTGDLPFDADSPAELMWKHLESPPQRLCEVNPACPEWLSRIIELLLLKDPNHRPCSAMEISDYLVRCLDEDLPQAAGDENISAVHDRIFEESFHVSSSVYNPSQNTTFGYQSSLNSGLRQDGLDGVGIGAALPTHAALDADKVRSSNGTTGAEMQMIQGKVVTDRGSTKTGVQTIKKKRNPSQTLQRIFSSIALTICLYYLLAEVVAPELGARWVVSMKLNAVGRSMTLAAIIYLFHAIVLSMPVYTLVAIRKGFTVAFTLWVKVIALFSAGLCLITALHILSVEQQAREVRYTPEARTYLSVVEPSVSTLFRVTTLSPHDVTYRLDAAGNSAILKRKLGSKGDATLPYLLAVFVYLWFFILMFFEGAGASYRLKRSAILATASSIFAVTLIWFESTAQELLKSLFLSNSFETYALKIGLFHVSIDNFSLGCALFNWVLLSASVVFLAYKLKKETQSL